MVAEYFLVRRWRGELDASRAEGRLPQTSPRIVPVALVIWVISALVGYFFTWGIPAISSLVLSIVLYTVAGKLGWVRGIGQATTAQSPAASAAPVAS